MALTSPSGRAAFPHVTDRERTDWLGMTCLTLCIALDLVVMVNYVVNRHYERYDVSRAAFYNLSDKTKSLLTHLKEPVNVVVFFSPENDLYEHVTNLLSEYERFSPHLHIEYVDPFRAPSKSEQVRRLYDIGQENVVIFSTGSGSALRKKYVGAYDLADYESGSDNPFEPAQPRLRALKAEQAFTSAILNVLQERQPKVYFLIGHGEHDPEDFDERNGYSSLATYLKRDNLQLAKLDLVLQPEVPADCDLLVIAGPTKRIAPAEVQNLRHYLTNGGRLLVLIDALTDGGLDPLLTEWNLRANRDVILGRVSLMGVASGVSAVAYVQEYGAHPVVDKMRGVSTQFPYACSIEPLSPASPFAPSKSKARVTELALTPESFWGERNFEEEFAQKRLKRDEGVDKPGPLAVAAAAEAMLPDGREAPRGGRVVLIGSSSFAANGALDGNNLDFFLNAVNWLLRRQELIGIAPKVPQEFALRMSPQQLFWTRLCVVFGLPGLVAGLGAVIWLVRRK
jgi:ABC-type uncharacterized transport system involved in gliding motility auxiliary subunit